MKLSNLKLLLTVLLISVVNCKDNTQRFVIVNNSINEIIALPVSNSFKTKETPCNVLLKGELTKSEYRDLIYFWGISPHSSKNIHQFEWGEYLLSNPADTMIIRIFDRLDADTLTCDEFNNIYPLKHEFKVTLEDMINCDWTLYYPLEKEER